MSGLPQIHALGIIDANGIRSNHSQSWPVPKSDLSFRDYFKALKSNPSAGVVSRRARARPRHGGMGGDSKRVPCWRRTANFSAWSSPRPMKYFQELFRLDVDRRRICHRRCCAADGTLLARYPMAGQIGDKASASVFAKLADTRSGVSRSVSPIDRTSSHCGGVSPDEISPRRRRDAERDRRVRRMAPDRRHDGGHRIRHDRS